MTDPSTLVEPSLPTALPATAPTRLAWVVVWSRRHPARIGETVFVESQTSTLVFGRGGATESDPGARAPLIRQRPGANLVQPPWEARGISRRQLVVRHTDEGPEVENVGRCELLLNGTAVQRALLVPGQVLHLRGQMSLLVTRRPMALDPARALADEDLPDFGLADRFGMVGESAAMWALRDRLAFAAGRRLHTLLLGATGTGKEVAAAALHALSERRAHPFVSRNAATIPDGLVDAELFGNVSGYPNPGMRERRGLVGEADGGTLFLDEFGELPLAQQAHLLRVLDDGEFHRLGESRARRSDFRLIGASNRDPSELKHDLFARLTLRITLPTLAERPEDIPLLLHHQLARAGRDDPAIGTQFCTPREGRALRIAPEVIHHALQAPHADNVRGLRTLLWQCIACSRGDWVELDPSLPPPAAPAAREPNELTAETLRAALRRHDGVIERVWRELGLRNRHVLRRLLKRHGIDPREAS